MAKLQRHIGLVALVIYGVGDILGAGIYGLVGKAAGEMGSAIWIAFAASMVAAGLTGLSYASLGSRHPKAGGAAYLAHRAFGSPFLAYVVGLAALCSGITSMATASRAFAGYFTQLVPTLPHEAIVIGFCLVIAGVVLKGIRESMWLNIVCTAIELSGLLLILVVGAKFVGSVNYLDAATPANPSGAIGLPLILSGAVLTFYSFIGFEDIINVSEEVKDPARNVPLGILFAVVISSVIYIGISIVSVSVIPPKLLMASNAPMVDVVKVAAPWFPTTGFTFIALFAVANTALLNFIMGSRLVYGMANEGLLPKALGKVSAKSNTPSNASYAILVLMLVLALAGNTASLARSTSVLLLFCFVVVNLSLIALKRRKSEKRGAFEVPYFVPVLGAVVCLAMLTCVRAEEAWLAGGLLLGIVGLYGISKRHRVNSKAR